MAWEIERRFLVRVVDTLWYTLGDGHHYRQGYIRSGEPSVRIRTGEAGAEVVINLRRDGEDIDISVTSQSRYTFMARRRRH